MRTKKATVALARETESVFGRTEDQCESDSSTGAIAAAEVRLEIDRQYGFSRYRDPVTQALGLLASEWEGMHKAWQGTAARALIAQKRDKETGVASRITAILVAYRDELRELRDGDRAKYLERELKAHVLYPWLKSHRGCPKSVHTARVISMIGDPLRFPGRQCEKCGGYLASDHEGVCNQRVKETTAVNRAEVEHGAGSLPFRSEPNPAAEIIEAEIENMRDGWVLCGGTVGAPRLGTGTRALWHYFGLHVVEGKRPRHQRGQQSDWKDEGYTALLQPDGIADMVIRQKCEPWYGVYVATKERICKERGVEQNAESERSGDAELGTDQALENESPHGPKFTRMHAHKIGRVVLAKAFVGDLLAEWKRLVSAH